MERLGAIEPSSSEYASPPVIVPKSDGSIRYCIDFRRLNAITRFDAEPLPNQDAMIGRMGLSRYFSKLDLTKGFWQIPIKENDRKYTAFVTEQGLKQFRYMPFGLVNVTAVFCRMVRKLLEGMTGVESYVDDIIIHTVSWEEHLKTLNELMKRLRQSGLTARPSKCELGSTRVEFLGHVVGGEELRPQKKLIEKVLAKSFPKTKKEIRSFIGTVGYYQKFIPRYAELAKPLADLTRKGEPQKIHWNHDATEAFEILKQKIRKEPILRLPKMHLPFILSVDASDVGIGGVLMQEEDGVRFPITFVSRKLRGPELNYSTIERECLALIWCITKLHMYLYGAEFVLETDHQPLAYLNKKKIDNGKVMRWALALQPYKYRVRVVKGAENCAADSSAGVSSDMKHSECGQSLL